MNVKVNTFMCKILLVSWKHKQGERTNVTVQLIEFITTEYVCLVM
jgi:hypothetical protein